ncbi:hypothetical protein [Rhodopila sp.]|uniref:hypothetical protein n=1 Tax=Rhodopila sp. TaxID=2480087 RepID=UPI003D11C0C0
MPEQPTEHEEDGVQLRELTCDPKFRRVLITDARNATGQAMAAAGAAIIFAGIADAWKPFPGEAALRAVPGVEIVALDLTDGNYISRWLAKSAIVSTYLYIPQTTLGWAGSLAVMG